jgi:hypothetical protein
MIPRENLGAAAIPLRVLARWWYRFQLSACEYAEYPWNSGVKTPIDGTVVPTQ